MAGPGGRIKRMKQSLSWPWTAHQVEALNDMMELLFRRISDASTITGILSVLHGGTGLSEFEPYQVVTGGTTTTGPLQQVAGVGNSGQVLTSNGAGVLPDWQDASTVASLDDLTDVEITAPQDGDILVFRPNDSDPDLWVNEQPVFVEWSVLTNGDPVSPELIFAGGDVIMLHTP